MPPSSPLMLSVSGARGIVGESMTPTVALEYAAAFGSFVRAADPAAQRVFCLGRDTRPSSEMLAAAATAGLNSVGITVIDLGVAATPTVAVMVKEHRAAGGLMITASHNPAPWNGLKCIRAGGIAAGADDVREVVRRFRQRDFIDARAEPGRETTADDRGNDIHVHQVLAGVDRQAISRAAPAVVLDSINGAGAAAGRLLLEELGCRVTHLNETADGRFAHEPEPVEANLEQLARQTAADEAAAGFAMDPDADRLAVVDEKGRYIGEEYTLVLAARRLLDLRGGSTVVANLSTSRMIDDIAAGYPGARVLRTPVGEANVAAVMRETGALVGGEGNGGVIVPAVCWTRDSLSAMALVLDLMIARRRPLGAIVNEVPAYVMIKHRFDLKDGSADFTRIVQRVASRFADEELDTRDGIRVDVEDGWVHLRPSNTEPIIRLIAEARTSSRAWELIDEVAVAAGLE